MEPQNPAAKSLANAFSLFLKDLNALPDEVFTRSFGPKVRTVADIVYEVGLVNDHIGHYLRGEDAFDWPEGWIKAPDELNSKERVIATFQASADRTIRTVSPYSAEEMDEKVITDEGETTRNERCRFMTIHVWYHLGQLNYIQTLIGDDAWHWA